MSWKHVGERRVNIELLGFATTLGLPRQAFRHGPESLRTGGLVRRLERLGAHVRDLGDMTVSEGQVSDPPPVRVAKTVEASRRQAEYWLRHHRPGNLMLTLGGDHTTSLGTLWALSEMGEPFDVVWIDAHGDFNTLQTSPSGNPHGMVLALACGLMPEYVHQLVPPSALRLWGIRDLDFGERLLLRREKVEIHDPHQTRSEAARLIDRLAPNVFVSFDIDSVEPAEAPATHTPVPGGFTRAQALDLVRRIAQRRRLLALDIVEFHPDKDRDRLTVELAMEVARVSVAGQLHRRAAKPAQA